MSLFLLPSHGLFPSVFFFNSGILVFVLSYHMYYYIYCKYPTEAGLLSNDRQMARCYDKRGNGEDLGGIE